ncbi:hypothetical protein [Heliorestis convoluta]|uniref:hypothetical protein n=1 Tax=Heliorestis convoluta TaxID=356322 RepID=UPI00129AD63F|nr:hypothetical protein [Heliorestis convoluta]
MKKNANDKFTKWTLKKWVDSALISAGAKQGKKTIYDFSVAFEAITAHRMLSKGFSLEAVASAREFHYKLVKRKYTEIILDDEIILEEKLWADWGEWLKNHTSPRYILDEVP